MPGKTKRNALKPRTLALAVAAAFVPSAFAEPPANQLPTGGQVGAGSVSISTTGTRMQIDQASDKAIINWQNFSIGSNAWVNFNQPSASSVVLNRSTQAAEIFGRLSANGQVFVTSGAGVYFGRSAQVDVGALLASNLSIRDQDFMAGRYVFTNEGSSGAVVNDGTIITPAGYAALAGTQVRNNGVIIAQAGTVALAAGDRVSLDMIGDGLVKVSVDAAALNALALNAGTIQADGGRVVLTARSANALLDTVVNNSGVIRATSLVERNGEIVLDGGSAGAVVHTGTLDVSGQGEGATGGTVTVRGQNVFVYGGINARGAGESGRGGMVETSGHYLEIGQAPDIGPGGTWLIDPYNITVVAGAGATNNAGSPTFTPTGDSSQIGNALINGQLNAGTSVILDTGGAGSPGTQAGDITVNALISKNVVNGASLTLNANNNIAVNASVLLLNGGVTMNAGGTVSLNASAATGDVQVSGTSQTINAQGLALSARDGRRATMVNAGGNQNITTGAGGVNLNVLNGAGVAQIVQNAPNSNQNVSTSGALNITGGSAAPTTSSGLFVNGAGTKQTVTAGSISLQGATTGNNGGAFILNTAVNSGDQEVNVTGGSIVITAGANGLANRAGISTNGNQAINGNPDITITGGTSGAGVGNQGNAAFISANATGKQQTIKAGTITLTSGAGGTDTSATITANKQTITATGDVIITGSNGSTGDSNGTRIGGVGGTTPGATDLTLTVGRDLILTGGGADNSGASLGSSNATVAPSNTITVSVGRDVILNGGAAAGARIGSGSAAATPGAGDIAITAARDIRFNAATNAASIRTTGNVTLNAGGGISENQSNAQILAGSLSSSSGGNTSLIGDNRLSSYQGSTTAGDLSLHNVGALTISGPVTSSGALELNVQGGLSLNAGTQDIVVTSRNGQTVVADSLSLHAENGRRAVLQNLAAGSQVVSVGSGGIDLDVVGGAGVAQIVNTAAGGNQLVSTTGILHVAGGVAAPSTGSGIFLIGVGTGSQTVSAGTIVLEGANNGLANSGALISTTQGDQSVSATGDIAITGGSVGSSGIFGAAGSNQDISANNIALANSATGVNNSGAFILGGRQHINASGDVTLTSRSSGGTLAGVRIGSVSGGTDLTLNVGGNLVLTGGTAPNNGAAIGSSAAGVAQTNDITIAAGGDVILNGGAAGSGVRIGSASNGLAGGNISISARDIRLNGGASVAAIRTAGNVELHANTISEAGNGFVQAAQLLTTSQGTTSLVGPNQIGTLTASSASGDVSLVNTGDLDIAGITAAGSVTIANTGSIGESGAILAASLTTSSTGSTTLNGANQVSSFNGTSTAGDVSLVNSGNLDIAGISAAGTASIVNTGSITESGAIHAVSLTTRSTGDTTLNGANQVSSFTGHSDAGNISLRNSSSVLTLGTMDFSGSLTVNQTGALAVPGTVTAGSQALSATGDATIGSAGGSGPAGLFAPGAISISTPGSIVLRGSDSAFAGASLVAAGGLVTLNGGEVHLVGGSAPLAAASVLGGDLAITSARDITLTAGNGWNADALLYSRSNITMTVGGILTIDGGHRPDNWARVQTERRDGHITLNFPNRHSGGFFVDGFEGKIKHGQDGFFTADKPAKLGQTLFLHYGL